MTFRKGKAKDLNSLWSLRERIVDLGLRYGPRTILRLVKPLLVVLGWAVSVSAILLAAVFQGYLTPTSHGPFAVGKQPFEVTYYYLALFGVSILASLVMEDPGLSLLGFFASYAVGAMITFSVLSLPAFLRIVHFPESESVTGLALTVTLFVFFPLAILIGLLGTFVGIGLQSRMPWPSA